MKNHIPGGEALPSLPTAVPIAHRLTFIDFGKGLAILGIVLYHYSQAFVSGSLEQLIQLGGAGVHLFVIFSGFTLSLSSKRLSALSFYKRRFVKIIIPYYLIICLTFLIKQVYAIYPESGWYAFFGHLLLFKMFDETIVTSLGTHFWFMSLIFQLYLIYPFLVSCLDTLQPKRFVVVILLVSIVYWILIAAVDVADMRVYKSSFLAHLWEFGLGMVLARTYRKSPNAFSAVDSRWVLVSAILGIGLKGAMAMQGSDMLKVFNDIPTVIGVGAFSVFAFKQLSAFPLAAKGIEALGKISYELYLVHILVWLLAKGLWIAMVGTEPTFLFKLLVVFPLAIVSAYGFSQFHTLVGKRLLSFRYA